LSYAKTTDKHKPIFRVPYLDKWVVVLSSPELINDLRKARDDDLSAAHGFAAVRINLPQNVDPKLKI
jgi:hypothetical protein